MALVRCPDCNNQMSDLAPACPNCGRPNDLVKQANVQPVVNAHLAETPVPATKADYGTWLLVVPLIGTLLTWFYVGNMNLFQGPGTTLNLITLATVAGTAILASMEAKKNGMVSDRAKGSYSPTAWFFIIALLWIVGYPAYLFKRRHYGLKNLLVGGLLLAVVFVGSVFAMSASIDAQVAKVQAAFNPS